jgi:ribosomal protein L29
MKKKPTIDLKTKDTAELATLKGEALASLKEKRVALHEARFAGFGARTKDSSIAKKARRDIARALTLKTQIETEESKRTTS